MKMTPIESGSSRIRSNRTSPAAQKSNSAIAGLDSASQPADRGVRIEAAGLGGPRRVNGRCCRRMFGGQEKRAFQHTVRIHPLYFNFRAGVPTV